MLFFWTVPFVYVFVSIVGSIMFFYGFCGTFLRFSMGFLCFLSDLLIPIFWPYLFAFGCGEGLLLGFNSVEEYATWIRNAAGINAFWWITGR